MQGDAETYLKKEEREYRTAKYTAIYGTAKYK